MERKSIADVLKSNRKQLSLSVDEVCARLNKFDISISPKTLYNYETGFRKPDADTLMALCDIYQIDDILLAFGYKEKEPAIENDDQLTPDEKIFMDLPENLRQDALRYMRFLAEQEGSQE